jgi:hypothetical protein
MLHVRKLITGLDVEEANGWIGSDPSVGCVGSGKTGSDRQVSSFKWVNKIMPVSAGASTGTYIFISKLKKCYFQPHLLLHFLKMKEH